MNEVLILILLMVCFFTGLVLGVPVVFIMGGLAIIFTYFLWGSQALITAAGNTFSVTRNSTLLAIPLFVFMGDMLRYSGIGEKLFSAVYDWAGGIRGGLAVGTLIICVIIAAMSGVSGAGTIMIGLLALPAMAKFKYDRALSLGTIGAGGLLAILIPPSTIIILYASIARLSVGRMFFAAFLPGFLLAALYIVYIIIRTRLQPDLAPPALTKATWLQRVRSLRSVVLPAILVIGVLGGIYLGVYTPTEAAGIGALGAMICAAIYRNLNWKVIKNAAYSTFGISAMVFWLILSAGLFSHVITVIGGQKIITNVISAASLGPIGVVIIMQLIIFILGMLVDDVVIVLLTTPIFVPIVASLGVNQIWFGTLVVININIAWLTPPYGFNLFYLKAITAMVPELKDTTMLQIWKSVIPFVGCQILCLIVVMAIPQIALLLPNIMLGK